MAHGAAVDARDRWGQTPLHVAVTSGSPGAAVALASAGARLSARLPERVPPPVLAPAPRVTHSSARAR